MVMSIIVAASTNNVIGVGGKMPWHLPEDLRHFRELTMGKPIIMGRLTHESIGRALPGRLNIVVSRQPGYCAAGCAVVASPIAAANAAADAGEIMVIGGGRIYREFMPLTDRIYLTRIHTHADGDVFFPVLDSAEWQRVDVQEFAVGSGRPQAFSFEIWQRVAR
jgi:dihydrofolate reductase